jgi:hypothetical protein
MACSSTLKMEPIRLSETSDYLRITRLCNPEDLTFVFELFVSFLPFLYPVHTLKIGWLVGRSVGRSCCSHLEHTASVKRFVSLRFLNLRHSVGLLGRVISPSQGRYLTNTEVPRVVFEPTIPAFERAKTVHPLDGAATVIGSYPYPYTVS